MVDKKNLSERIGRITVIGAGTMGPGIAQTFASGGYEVAVWDVDSRALERAKKRIANGIDTCLRQGIITGSDADKIFGKICFVQSLEKAVSGADFIMETIVEDIEMKREFYIRLAELAGREAIIASNTSALNIFEIVPRELLNRQLIVHWYGPAQLVPLVDVVKSGAAPQELLDITVAVLRKCGKAPVIMKKFIKGYIVNRLLQCLNREIFYLLDNDYCTAEDIDYAARISFIPRAMVLGLCKKIDFGGVDMTINNYKCHSYCQPPEIDLPRTLQELQAQGRFGIKSGKGFYDYEGIDIDHLFEKRDRQLIEAYKMARKFLDDSV